MEAEISINYLAISTELIVIFTIVGTISLDLILSKKSKYLVALFALAGSLISFIPIIFQWANYSKAIVLFEGSYVIDKFSIILKGLFILITYLTFCLVLF